MGTTVDSLYMRPSFSGRACSERGGRPAEAAAAESSLMVGPFEGAGGAVDGALLSGSGAPEVEGGVLDMLPLALREQKSVECGPLFRKREAFFSSSIPNEG